MLNLRRRFKAFDFFSSLALTARRLSQSGSTDGLGMNETGNQQQGSTSADAVNSYGKFVASLGPAHCTVPRASLGSIGRGGGETISLSMRMIRGCGS
jgi:hypothetical protein